MNTLIIEGTAREGRKSIHAARFLEEKLQNSGHKTFLYDVKQKNIPPLGNRPYKDDEEPVPEDIKELSREVVEADLVVIVTPEYNHSIPGVLKNAMDYLYPEYDGKPFGYITVSGGGFGGVRAQSHLHDITLAVGGRPGPSMPVSRVGSVFDDEGDLQDESYDERFENFVEKLEDFVDSVS